MGKALTKQRDDLAIQFVHPCAHLRHAGISIWVHGRRI
jgi:hypothetical protein